MGCILHANVSGFLLPWKKQKGMVYLKFYCEDIATALEQTKSSREGLTSAEAQKLHYELRGIIPAASALASDATVSADAVAVGQSLTMQNTAVGQPTIPEMGNYWGPADTMGAAINNKEVTAGNAQEQTDLFEESLNGSGL